MRDLEHIKLYQGENDDILRRPPSFLVKAGTLLICLTLTGMLILSNYIMIPDMIHTKLVIPKDRIPASIIYNASRIQRTSSTQYQTKSDY